MKVSFADRQVNFGSFLSVVFHDCFIEHFHIMLGSLSVVCDDGLVDGHHAAIRGWLGGSDTPIQ